MRLNGSPSSRRYGSPRARAQVSAVDVLLALSGVALAPLALGCGDKPADAAPTSCVADLTTDCHPLYDPPTYTTIFNKILQPTCAQGMGTCHTSDGAKAGLVFESEEDSYALLLGTRGGRKRVLPSDPSCSLLMVRLESTDPNFRMPPGPTPLLDSERCDIIKWIAEGAAR